MADQNEDEELAETIKAMAKTPRSVTGDEGTVTERSIDELITADRYDKSQGIDAVPYGMRIAKIKFPGTQG